MSMLDDVIELGQPVRTISPAATVLEAIDEMCRWHVRAVVVGSAADPLGILSARDVLERVVRPQLDPATTLVITVMTAPVVCLPATVSPEEGLATMRAHGVHQAPVVGEEALIGVVSSSDIRRWVLARQEQHIDALESYVMGG